MPRSLAIHWFRSDLRLADNPALAEVARAGRLLALFIDETAPSLRPRGGAARWWLHHSLQALDTTLRKQGNALALLRGDPRVLLPALARDIGADRITWSRRHGGAERALDGDVKSALRQSGIAAESFNASLLYEPMEMRPMRVFTPFWKAARALRPLDPPCPAPKHLPPPPETAIPGRLALRDLRLLPAGTDRAEGFSASWQPGEAGAHRRLATFLEGPLRGYRQNRDRMDVAATSRLSPHLAFGEISPRQIAAAITLARETGEAPSPDCEKFLAELGWREFSHHLLFHNPDLAAANIQKKFDSFPWREDAAALRAWRRGETGYPLVDAGMRELWRCGSMHNRARMITASFLIKHLLLDWRHGEQWFWDTLVDADPANNAAGWQWVAGSGADAAPFFRIFNPVSQGGKFDPSGAYIRTHLPELARLPDSFIHAPWTAPAPILERAGITLGDTYPRPIVDHAAARSRALAAFRSISGLP